MGDTEIVPHIIFPLASPLILLSLFICLLQSISSCMHFFSSVILCSIEFFPPTLLFCERCLLFRTENFATGSSGTLFLSFYFSYFYWHDTGIPHRLIKAEGDRQKQSLKNNIDFSKPAHLHVWLICSILCTIRSGFFTEQNNVLNLMFSLHDS